MLVTETGEVDVEEGVDAAEMSLGPAELSGEEEAGPSATLVTPNTSLHYLDTLAQHGSTGEYYSHISLLIIKSFHSPCRCPRSPQQPRVRAPRAARPGEPRGGRHPRRGQLPAPALAQRLPHRARRGRGRHLLGRLELGLLMIDLVLNCCHLRSAAASTPPATPPAPRLPPTPATSRSTSRPPCSRPG